MALNMQLLKDSVTVYGAPLYGHAPSTLIGTPVVGEDGVDSMEVVDGSLSINNGEMYIPIRRSVLEADGFDPSTHEFTIGKFTALRDAEGVYNDTAWSIAKGEEKTFAY